MPSFISLIPSVIINFNGSFIIVLVYCGFLFYICTCVLKLVFIVFGFVSLDFS